jgi:hypothetical protein
MTRPHAIHPEATPPVAPGTADPRLLKMEAEILELQMERDAAIIRANWAERDVKRLCLLIDRSQSRRGP